MFRGERGIEALGLQAEQSGGGTSSAFGAAAQTASSSNSASSASSASSTSASSSVNNGNEQNTQGEAVQPKPFHLMSMSEQIAYLRKERELREMRKNKKEEGEGGEGGEQGEGRKEEQENEQDENEYSSHGRERFESGFPRYQTNGSKDSFDEEPLFSDRRIGVNENSNEAAEQSEQTEQQESYPPILSPALRFSSSKANLMMHNLTGAHEGFGERGKEGEFNADVREEEE